MNFLLPMLFLGMVRHWKYSHRHYTELSFSNQIWLVCLKINQVKFYLFCIWKIMTIRIFFIMAEACQYITTNLWQGLYTLGPKIRLIWKIWNAMNFLYLRRNERNALSLINICRRGDQIMGPFAHLYWVLENICQTVATLHLLFQSMVSI